MERMKRMSKRSTFLLALLMFVFAAWPAGLIRAEESTTSTVQWDSQTDYIESGWKPRSIKSVVIDRKGQRRCYTKSRMDLWGFKHFKGR